MNQRFFSLFCTTWFMCALTVFVQVSVQSPGWNTTGSLGLARTRHTATLLANGKVLVVGGLSVPTPCCRIAESAEIYDPMTGQWSATGSPSKTRYDQIAVRLTSGKLLILGGSGDPTGSAEIYDPATGNWAATSTPIASRLSPRATILADGRVLVTGFGVSANSITRASEFFDPTTHQWTSTGAMNALRLTHSITLLSNGKVLVAGGGNSISDFRTAEIYDPSTNNWTVTGDLLIPRAKHQATLLANGRVLVAGGVSTSGSPIAGAELYDPATGQWSISGNMTTPRSLHTLTLLPNGKALASGGVADNLTFDTLNSAELYDPVTGTWTLTDTLGEARRNHTATLLPNGKVLIVAGEPRIGVSSSVTIASTELYDSGAPNITNVSAASFVSGQLAPEAIVAAFGTNLATSTQAAIGLPLPMQLAGTSVRVRDSLGIERVAPVFFVSPSQINYLIPPSTATGTSIVTVTSGAVSILEVSNVSPGLFSVDASGAGLAAAVVFRVKASGEQVYEPVGQFDSATGRFVALPIDVSNPAEQVFLLLYGTGFRNHSGLNNVRVTINGGNAEALFAGTQGSFVGLDQCNVRLPNSLAGRGEISIALTVDGKTSNTVKARIK